MTLRDSVQSAGKPGDFTGEWDPELMRRVVKLLRPIAKLWHRSQVRGLERIPPGGALIVANHSGGVMPMDIPVIAIDFFEHFGYDRPLYHLGHDMLFKGPQADLLHRAGLIRASRDNAEQALRSGATVIVFPGGDYDAFRPSWSANVIDFGRRTGYVTTAVQAGVPIVPAVLIGGQENQIYLTRGRWLGKRLGLKRLLRTDMVPIALGVPFGVTTLLPPNLPLPTKITAEILEPINIVEEFGEEPDVAEVDKHVRSVMQKALTRLAAKRRLPVIG
ncbi:lysophospholipid acyltransferase family protein [uncultured Mycobacterium sp.]|uniref:lysophospholipid acyltransferase family protein n=1 Tax=uncultured Mycobacterium sp. TaxID=171292 RepID=UPI0035CBE245